MSNLPVEFHPAALHEVESTQRWYASRNQAASKAFVNELSHAIKKVSETPERWPRYYGETRRYFFPRFPFSVIYRKKDHLIEIIAVMHHRRRPEYWSKRVKK